MRRAALGVALVIVGVVAAPGHAQPSIAPWNGANPFHCVLQQAGTGATVPDPGADPYCVEFDKTHQNVTQLGVVDFLSHEPARVAAAAPKCFYFQSDHWRGSIVQGNGATQTYAWDGHYFYDKARGEGGAWVTNFSINGHSADPSQVPGMPQEWTRNMGPGTAGALLVNDIPVDPACAARANSDPGAIYVGGHPPGSVLSETPNPGPPPPAGPCLRPRGRVAARRLGPVVLGERDSHVRARLGDPLDARDGFLVYCVRGGGGYMVGELWNGVGPVRDETSAPTVMILTTARAYRLCGVGPGSPAEALERFTRALVVTSVGRTRIWALAPGSGVVFGVRGGRVRFVAVYDHHHRRALASLVRRAL